MYNLKLNVREFVCMLREFMTRLLIVRTRNTVVAHSGP